MNFNRAHLLIMVVGWLAVALSCVSQGEDQSDQLLEEDPSSFETGLHSDQESADPTEAQIAASETAQEVTEISDETHLIAGDSETEGIGEILPELQQDASDSGDPLAVMGAIEEQANTGAVEEITSDNDESIKFAEVDEVVLDAQRDVSDADDPSVEIRPIEQELTSPSDGEITHIDSKSDFDEVNETVPSVTGIDRSHWQEVTVGPDPGVTYHHPVYFADWRTQLNDNTVRWDDDVESQLRTAMDRVEAGGWNAANALDSLAGPVKFLFDFPMMLVRQVKEPVWAEVTSP